MSKIMEYSEAARFDANDIIIKDGSGGTKKMLAKNAAVEFAGLVSSINHRNVYRGKYLGGSVSSAQKAAIADGSFDDLFIGDYWTIGGMNYRIADMDYWMNCGDQNFTTHHLVIVPDSSFGNKTMNASDTTNGGYANSLMRTENLNDAKTKINAAFGSMVKTHREYLTNAVSNGKPSAGAWFDSDIELMNEIMVYGCHVYAVANDGATVPNKYTAGNSQLSLFRLNPSMIKRRYNYWLRDVVNASGFALVNYYGYAGCNNASATGIGVRPVFLIG